MKGAHRRPRRPAMDHAGAILWLVNVAWLTFVLTVILIGTH